MADVKNYQMLIDGDWVDAADGGTFDSVNPANIPTMTFCFMKFLLKKGPKTLRSY